MAAPRIFVSSTAYDLGHVRGQLRSAIQALAFEPVLSEYSDILYDPRDGAQLSCIKEIATCDALVLVVGSRFGSNANSSALAEVDDDLISMLDGRSAAQIDSVAPISVTQLELLKAVEDQIPVFAFVEERLLHDHSTYLRNRSKSFAGEIEFASISQPEYAEYIFSFLDFLQARVVNNAIFPFSRIEDIEVTLKRQWASLFQRLLAETRMASNNRRQVDALSEQLDDLKIAILSSIGDGPSREVARATIQFRLVIEALRSIGHPDLRAAIERGDSWEQVLATAEVVEVLDEPSDESRRLSRVLLRMRDDTLFIASMSSSRFRRLSEEWSSYCAMPAQQRLAVFDGVSGAQGPAPSRFTPTRQYEYDSFMEQVVRVPTKSTSDLVYGDEEPF